VMVVLGQSFAQVVRAGLLRGVDAQAPAGLVGDPLFRSRPLHTA
jgi:hypothetical protein